MFNSLAKNSDLKNFFLVCFLAYSTSGFSSQESWQSFNSDDSQYDNNRLSQNFENKLNAKNEEILNQHLSEEIDSLINIYVEDYAREIPGNQQQWIDEQKFYLQIPESMVCYRIRKLLEKLMIRDKQELRDLLTFVSKLVSERVKSESITGMSGRIKINILRKIRPILAEEFNRIRKEFVVEAGNCRDVAGIVAAYSIEEVNPTLKELGIEGTGFSQFSTQSSLEDKVKEDITEDDVPAKKRLKTSTD